MVYLITRCHACFVFYKQFFFCIFEQFRNISNSLEIYRRVSKSLAKLWAFSGSFKIFRTVSKSCEQSLGTFLSTFCAALLRSLWFFKQFEVAIAHFRPVSSSFQHFFFNLKTFLGYFRTDFVQLSSTFEQFFKGFRADFRGDFVQRSRTFGQFLNGFRAVFVQFEATFKQFYTDSVQFLTMF